jgi:8-oxo-dGTP diphosphatase
MKRYKLTKQGKYWGTQGAGLIVYKGKEILLGLRSKRVKEAFTWSYPGGKIDEGESPQQSVVREFKEETRYDGDFTDMNLLHVFEDKEHGFKYFTYMAEVPMKFEAIKNWETVTFKWFDIEDLPSNLHFGMKHILPKVRRELT